MIMIHSTIPTNSSPPPRRPPTLSAQANKHIFLITVLLLAAALVTAAALADRDTAMHKSHYARYQQADEMFRERQFEQPYEIYKSLSEVYKDTYVLELKMAVCAMNLDMWEEALEHSRRSVEMYPLLVKDEDFIDSVAYTLEKMGEDEAAAGIRDYYYNFVILQE
ncbi:MAG: hypothetical protein FWH01_16185 [Oscillospiraceae bacterium]|nr:hypothetical protein [Oscillospiraceae bacterium]